MTRTPVPLFRAEALQAQRPKLHGEIVLARRLPCATLSVSPLVAAAAVIAFLGLGRYADHVTVTGMVVPDLGIVELRAPQPGRIVRRQVHEGDRVAAGAPLFVITSERESALGPTGAQIRAALDLELAGIEAQLRERHLLEQAEYHSLRARTEALDAEAGTLESMVAVQTERVTLADAAARRQASLRVRGYVSVERLADAQARQLDEHSRLKALERELIANRHERAERERELQTLALRQRAERFELDRASAALRRQRSEAEARRELIVRAPVAGTATAVLAEHGQVVDSERTLVSILPDPARLEGRLFVPSHAAGFVEVGDTVALRYEAYPHERFGHQPGRITEVSRVALGAHELGGGRLAGTRLGPGPFYRVTVSLPAQHVALGDRHWPLKAGMLLEAELHREARRLYQWLLDPHALLAAGP